MKAPRQRHGLSNFLLASALFSISLTHNTAQTRGDEFADVVNLSRQFLSSQNVGDRKQLSGMLATYEGDIEPILEELSARTYKPVKPGYHPEEHFTVRALVKKHPDDLLYFTVPRSYHPSKPTGLIVFMHGGGNTSSRKAPRYFMNFLTSGTEAESSQLGDVFAETGMIAVGPSAPWDRTSSYRWCLRESEEYLADVIAECKTRFNIDPDRVFLIGHSMGGFGAYHHAQRQPDRFAAVIVNSGSWSQAYLPAMQGTALCIIQGVNDARKGIRWHYTDIEYARWTHKLLQNAKIAHTYFEHDGKHSVGYGRKYIAKFLKSSENLRRDPYYAHITLASPSGFRSNYCSSVIHNRWLTLDEPSKGNLTYDALLSNGKEDSDAWELEHHRTKRSGSAIDAKNNLDNSITVTTQNVKRFTVWLHPKMVDTTKPVKIKVNGKTAFAGTVKPSLAKALESYERRGDWGLVYPIKIELTVPGVE